VCTIKQAVDPILLNACNAKACNLTEEVRSLVRSRGIDPDDKVHGFSFLGAHQRDPGNHSLLLCVLYLFIYCIISGRLDLRNHYSMDREPFNHSSLGEEGVWMGVVRKVLGDNAKLLWKGCVSYIQLYICIYFLV
jgi:hypothetical protein